MINSLQIVVGFVIGLEGLLHIAASPVPGCSALFVGGFLIMEAVDHLGPAGKEEVSIDGNSNGKGLCR